MTEGHIVKSDELPPLARHRVAPWLHAFAEALASRYAGLRFGDVDGWYITWEDHDCGDGTILVFEHHEFLVLASFSGESTKVWVEGQSDEVLAADGKHGDWGEIMAENAWEGVWFDAAWTYARTWK